MIKASEDVLPKLKELLGEDVYEGYRYVDTYDRIRPQTQIKIECPDGLVRKSCYLSVQSLGFWNEYRRIEALRKKRVSEEQRRQDEFELRKRYESRDIEKMDNSEVSVLTDFVSTETYSYTYRIDCSVDNSYYYGVRSCVGSPYDDVGYMGSGIRIKSHIEAHGVDHFSKSIDRIYIDRESAEYREIDLLREHLEEVKCLNITDNMGKRLSHGAKVREKRNYEKRSSGMKVLSKTEISELAHTFSPPDPKKRGLKRRVRRW